MLTEEVLEQIQMLVRSGFYDRDRVLEIICEEAFAPGEVERNQASEAVDVEFRNLRAEQATWPASTDCDRLDDAFQALHRRGVITLHNAGYTQSDGYSDILDAYESAPDKARVTGYCFYHAQDVERAIRGGGLNLAFGPMDPKQEQTQGPIVGKVICDELARHGLPTDWDGTFDRRILVPRFRWQKRLVP